MIVRSTVVRRLSFTKRYRFESDLRGRCNVRSTYRQLRKRGYNPSEARWVIADVIEAVQPC